MRPILRNLSLLAFLALAVHSVVHTGAAPASWGLASLCLWGAVFSLRGWTRMDLWEQRLFVWAIFSIGSFAHFLKGDAQFTGWSSVYYFCGADYQYCTSTFRWNFAGWRKAIVLWNFCLSTALALQRLAIESGLGGLLPGEEAIARESFISIAWRLIPFWLNHWESNFGAECSSILFELPHFALELLVVLPLVQIIAGRLRVVGHPHLRADEALPPDQLQLLAQQQQQRAINNGQRHRHNRNNQHHRHRQDDPPVALAPDVLRCAWVNDSSQLRLVPRLRAHKRTMAIIACITIVAAFNALVVPLAIEKQAYIAPRSRSIFEYEAELEAVVSAGAAAERNIYYLEKEQVQKAAAIKKAGAVDGDVNTTTTSSNKISNIRFDAEKLLSLVPCVAAHNCTAPLTTEILAALRYRQKSGGGGGAWLGETLSSYFASYVSSLSGEETSGDGGEEDDAGGGNRYYAGPLLVPTHWAIQLIADLDEKNASKQTPAGATGGKASGRKIKAQIDPERLATLLFDLNAEQDATTSSSAPSETSSSSYFSSSSGNGNDSENDEQLSSSLLQTGMDAIDSVLAAASAATLGHYKLDLSSKHQPTEFETMRNAYLKKVAAGAAAATGASSSSSPSSFPFKALVLPRWYRTMHKHVIEMRRMEDEEHRNLVPLVESALAIMRLSCERWFALIGVYLGYLLFRDPPPAARAAIRFVARVSRIFQRAILLSFPAVCWIYGAGLVFSTFASVIFWAGPVLRGLEHLRSATASVAPREWHDATEVEFERMGGLCAICWGELETSSSSRTSIGSPGTVNGNGTATERETVLSEGNRSSLDVTNATATATNANAGSTGGVHRIRAAGLTCGHAYHRRCIVGWLQSCYGQGRTPTCPMCQTEVPIRIKYRLPMTANAVEEEAEADGAEAGADGNNADGGGGGHLHRREPGIPGLDMLVDELSEEFRHRFEPPMGLAHIEINNNNNLNQEGHAHQHRHDHQRVDPPVAGAVVGARVQENGAAIPVAEAAAAQ